MLYYLREPAHGAADAAVAEHDGVGLGPVRGAQRDSLGVEEGVLERLQEVLHALVLVGERLDLVICHSGNA